MILITGVRFRKSGKVYYFDPTGFDIKKGDHVIVETARGIEYGLVVLGQKQVTDDKVVQPLKPVIRIATEHDDKINAENEEKEKEAFDICIEKIAKHGLEMKLIDCEYTFDKNKLLFYFTADGRIDFRELVKDLASIFRTRIELRQIGVRDETKLIGGIGICGRPLCCHTFLSEFAPVSIKMAKEQNLSLNPSKISGVCGRLMCCLKNEEEAYEYLNERLPHINETVSTADGYTGTVQSVSVLKQLVKVVITKENDEKEVREYHVDDLQFEKSSKRTSPSPGLALPDEELDENALKELEKMEKGDIEDLAEEAEQNKQKNKRQPKKNFNKHKKNFEQKENSHDNFQVKKGRHQNRENYHQTQKNFRRGNGNNNGGYNNNYNNFKPE
ncbi:stage 0 sporulation family protein [Eubacterium sp. MSJ-13]|nr:stage 0 sporulation family protein [Eubacterium sp. MSJ-13]